MIISKAGMTFKYKRAKPKLMNDEMIQFRTLKEHCVSVLCFFSCGLQMDIQFSQRRKEMKTTHTISL